MDLSTQMILFAKVVENESFSATARSLGATPSSVSRRIAQLEDRFGVRLVKRTTSGLLLTDEGREFYERCAEVASRVAEAETIASSISAEPRGRLTVVATVAFAKAQLMGVLPRFLGQYPELALTLELTDRTVDLSSEPIDLAIRFSEQVESTTDIARKIARNRRVLCAAPAYLEQRGTPVTAQDLARHNCLRLSMRSRWNDWAIIDDVGQPVEVSGNFEANSADAIYHATLAGLGIARLSTYLVGRDMQAGRLKRVLPEYQSDGSDILAMYAERRNLPPKVRAFIDYLSEQFGSTPPWEQDEAAAHSDLVVI